MSALTRRELIAGAGAVALAAAVPMPVQVPDEVLLCISSDLDFVAAFYGIVRREAVPGVVDLEPDASLRSRVIKCIYDADLGYSVSSPVA